MKYGVENSNFRHGGYCFVDTFSEIKQGLAKDLLRRILTTPCGSRGEIPFTADETRWAMDIVSRRLDGDDLPRWAATVLDEIGIQPR